VAVTRAPNGRLVARLFAQIANLAEVFKYAERIFIDVPMGLPWAGVPVRPCDRLARTILGTPRHASVFPLPCREALAARDLSEAQRINVQQLGRSIGLQTWRIAPLVSAVDRLLLNRSTHNRPTIREVHPEVCFWALAGQRPMAHRRKTSEGRVERLSVIERFEPAVHQLLAQAAENAWRDVQVDDVLDATVAFITAEAVHGDLVSLASSPSHDLEGLPMEMFYLNTESTTVMNTSPVSIAQHSIGECASAAPVPHIGQH